MRKDIQYKYTDTRFTVEDYMRQLVPKELTVPIFPENDMVLIQAERIGDIWFGHVHSLDSVGQNTEVYFFAKKSQNNENIYIREIRGKGAKNTVQWNSVIGIAQGYWRNQSSWIRTVS